MLLEAKDAFIQRRLFVIFHTLRAQLGPEKYLSYFEHLHQLHRQVQITCQLDLALHEGLHAI